MIEFACDTCFFLELLYNFSKSKRIPNGEVREKSNKMQQLVAYYQ